MNIKQFINPIFGLLAMFALSMSFVSCSTSDNPIYDDSEDDQEVIAQPVHDVIETYLVGDIAVVGNHFDEVTTYILSRANGQIININLYDPIPESVKYLLLDDQTVQNITADDIDNFIIPAYRQGVTICMHKPSDWKASGILMGLWQVEWGTEGEKDVDNDQAAGSRKTRAIDNGTSDTDSSYDFWAMKPGGKTFQLTDIYVPDKVYTDTMHIIEHQENGDVERDSIYTVTSAEPTPYQYGLFAEQAVKWLNETPAEAKARATRAGITGDGTKDNPYTVVSSASMHYANLNANKGSGELYPVLTCPIKFSVWASMMYNFENDEDYYSVVVEEEIDARNLYLGEYYSDGNDFHGWWLAGFTWLNFGVRTRWPHDDYTIRHTFDILPQGEADPVTTEEIRGWTVSPTVSIGLDGVTAKPISFKNEKKVSKVTRDVQLTNSKDANGNWMVWTYVFGSQIEYKGNVGKPDLVTPESNAACRSLKTQNQGWKWVVSNTKQRGTVPFHFRLNISLMEATQAEATSIVFVAETRKHIIGLYGNRDFDFDLPVPQRCKHVYSLTTDEISDLAEFNNLMTALRNVSTNFNSLYNKLIRLDEDGNPAGRTGVTNVAIVRMVGQEWYNLAHELVNKEIKVKKTYKFYVKDETGGKLGMIKNENGHYVEKGTCLVIAPNGIRIEEDQEYKYGEGFTTMVNDYELSFRVVKEKAEVELVSAPSDISGEFSLPATVRGMNVVKIGNSAFINCDRMTNLTLPTTIREIGNYAFKSCGITELFIPEGVTAIPKYMALSCRSLKTVYIPSTVKKIGRSAFFADNALRDVLVRATTPPAIDERDLPFAKGTIEQGTLYIPKGCMDVYRNGIWASFNNIEESIFPGVGVTNNSIWGDGGYVIGTDDTPGNIYF